MRSETMTARNCLPPNHQIADIPTSTTAFSSWNRDCQVVFALFFTNTLNPLATRNEFCDIQSHLNAPVISLSHNKRCSFRFVKRDKRISLQKTNDEPSWHNEPNSLTFKVTKRRCVFHFEWNNTLSLTTQTPLSCLCLCVKHILKQSEWWWKAFSFF